MIPKYIYILLSNFQSTLPSAERWRCRKYKNQQCGKTLSLNTTGIELLQLRVLFRAIPGVYILVLHHKTIILYAVQLRELYCSQYY